MTALLAGCGSPAPPGVPGSGAPHGFPVTVTNCGVTTTYDRPPARAVALNQHAIETMLALDLQDSMVGTAFLDDQILPEHRAAYESVPVLAEEYPSYEVLLNSEPDFVYGGWMSAFDEKEGRDRRRLADAGIATHLNAEDCADGPVTMATADDEIRTLGRIFGIGQRAERVVEQQRHTFEAARAAVADAAPVTVAVYDSGDTTVYTSGGHGIGDQIIEASGAVNLFADVPKVWADVSFEQFAERAPDVIVIYDYGDQPLEHKKRFLRQHPMLQQVPAIRHERFAVLPLSSITAGVRVGRAVDELARQLHPEQFR
ncbi:ABC transporter substrate-binding protein [Mycolicibacterium rutilum]|nr:ABC transporter substrate-binding protein [Mycolicibacterium rutilum]